MTEEQKTALPSSLVGKKVSEMTAEKRELFDSKFKYGFSTQLKTGNLRTPDKPTDLRSTDDFLNGKNMPLKSGVTCE